MANPEHAEVFSRGVDAWNEWRSSNPATRPDLSGAELTDLNMRAVDLSGALLEKTDFSRSFLGEIDLRGANCREAVFRDSSLVNGDGVGSDFSGATLESAFLAFGNWRRATFDNAGAIGISFQQANLEGASLRNFFTHGADFFGVTARDCDLADSYLVSSRVAEADFSRAILQNSELEDNDFARTNLSDAVMVNTKLRGANFTEAKLTNADLHGSDLSNAAFVRTDMLGADLSGCRIYGVASWDLQLDGTTKQSGMIITPPENAELSVDDIEVAQFVYLLLNNRKIQNVINTVGEKGVLVLGRFTERKQVLEAIRRVLREHGYLPIVFDFEKPTDRDFTETVRTLAGMSRFIVAEITHPRSVPLESQAVIPDYMIPFVPLIEHGERPFSMFRDLWQKHRDWVLDPLTYRSIEQLTDSFDEAVIRPANERLLVLRKRKAEELVMRDVSDYG